MSTYASKTDVSVEKSKIEIEQTLQRYGAAQFVYGWKDKTAIIGFHAHGRMIRFELPLPDKNEHRFHYWKHKNRWGETKRTGEQALKIWEQECRTKWRALLLVIKAKLEAVASGITTFEQEFLAHTVLPNGQVFHRWAEPQIEQAYQTREMPPLLGAGMG